MGANQELSYRDLADKLDRANRALSRELAERKRAEAVLRESENKYRTLYTASRDAVMVLKPGERFISGNPATLTMFRCKDEDEFISKAPADFSPPRQPDGRLSTDKAREVMDLAVANGSHFFDWVHRRLDGEDFPATVLLTRMELGGEILLQATVRDVTATREMEAHLRQSEKMQAIGQLAGGIAHDFNNRLVAIHGFAQILCEEVDDPRLRDYAQRILTGAKRAANLTTQLLAFARRGEHRAVPVDMHELIAEALMFLEHTIGKHICVRFVPDAGTPVVMGDPAQLQNVLLNLALNARDAMAHGGTLTFATTVLSGSGVADAKTEAAGRLRISVTDTGVGMTREVRERIFEPFFTTKSPHQGTGMGLASAYGVIQRHGGSIEVRSAPGAGSTFTIILPLCPRRDGAARTGDARPTARKRGRVMVVDDEEDARDFIRIFLERSGHEVAACADGEEALAVFRERWREIDVVILDMVMPGMDGAQTFSALRAIDPAVQVILVTGYELEAKVRELQDKGVCELLRKPFDMQDLAEAIGRVLRG